MSAIAAWIILAALFPCTQDPPADVLGGERETLFGRVEAKDGSAWHGARVVLRSRPLADLDTGPVDTVVVLTDERGKFRAEVLPGRTYTAWARGSVAAGGSYRGTAAVENVVSRTPTVLRELGKHRRTGTVRLRGLAAWKHRGPFRCLIASSIKHQPEAAIAIDADTVTVPPLPGSKARIELLGRGDHPIHAFELRLDELPESFPIPPPWKVTLRPKTGKQTFPGGRFVAAWRGRILEVADVPQTGVAEVELPRGVAPGSYRLLAPGFAPSILAPAQPAAATWGGTLVAGATIRGRLWIRPGEPAARWTIVVRHGSYTVQATHHQVGVWSEVLQTDADGRFEIPCTYSAALVVLLRREDARNWPQHWRSVAQDAVRLSALPARGDVDVGDIVMSERFWVADVRLVANDGSPAGGRLVIEPGRSGDAGETLVWTTRLGHARVLLPKGDLAVVARSRDQWRVLRVDVDGSAGRPIPLTLRLDAAVYVAGELREVGGAPARRVRFNLMPSHREPARLLGEPPPAPTGEDFRFETSLDFPNNRLQNLVIGELNRNPILTDDAGRFRCSMPRMACTLQASQHPDARKRIGPAIEFEGTAIRDLKLRL